MTHQQSILHLVGGGLFLKVPHASHVPTSLVQGFHDAGRCAPGQEHAATATCPFVAATIDIPVDFHVASELIVAGRLTKLTPDRAEGRNRIGWRELGLDGATADFYAIAQ